MKNRAEAIRTLAALEAVAAAIRKGLKAEARDEHEGNGTAVQWRVPGVLVTSSIQQNRVEVTDLDDLLTYLVEHYPTEVQTVVQVRNQAWLKQWLASLLKVGKAADGTAPVQEFVAGAEARPVPGVQWVKGGAFGSISVTVNPAAKAELGAHAAVWLSGGAPLPELAGILEAAPDEE